MVDYSQPYQGKPITTSVKSVYNEFITLRTLSRSLTKKSRILQQYNHGILPAHHCSQDAVQVSFGGSLIF